MCHEIAKGLLLWTMTSIILSTMLMRVKAPATE